MPNYQKSQIYKLVSNKTADIYIGSCLMRLSTRLSQHKCKANSCSSKKLFVNDAIITIVLIENYPCNTKNELKARELHHITTNNCININKPFVCEIIHGDKKEWDKEYQLANKEQISTKRKEYYAINADQIKSKAKEYYAINVEQIKSKAKEYKAINVEQIKAKANKYKAINVEKIKSKAKEYKAINAEHIKEYKASHKDRANALQRTRRAEKKLTKNLENTLNNNIII